MEDLKIKVAVDTDELGKIADVAEKNAKAAVEAGAKVAKSEEARVKALIDATQEAETAKVAAVAQAAKKRAEAEAAAAAAATQAVKLHLDQQGRLRDEHGKFVTQGIKGVSNASKKSHEDQSLGWRAVSGSVEMLGKSLSSYAGQMVGVSTASAAISSIGEAIGQQYEKINRLSDDFIAKRDQMRELAGILGKDASSGFTLEQAKWATTTAQSIEEQRSFRGAFQGSGAQHIGTGKHLDDAQGAIYEQQAAAYLTSQGLDPTTAGDLAGTFLGSSDFMKKGGAKAAMDSLARSNTILQAGRGDPNQNARNLAQVSAAQVGDDKLRSLFSSNEEAATAVSVMAEFNPAESAQMVQASMRAFRDFTGDAAPLLKKAGITPQTKYFDAAKAMNEVIQKEAIDKGINSLDYIKQYIPDERAATAVNVMMNRGVAGGVIDARTAAAQGMRDPNEVITAFQTDVNGPGPARIGAAIKAQADLTTGAQQAAMTPLKSAAEGLATLRRDHMSMTGALGRVWGSLPSTLTPAAAGFVPQDQKERDAIIAEEMAKQRAAAGLNRDLGLKVLQDQPWLMTKGSSEAVFAKNAAEIAGASGKTTEQVFQDMLMALQKLVDQTKPSTPPAVQPPRPMNRGGMGRP